MATLPKIEWLGTAEDARRVIERKQLEADIEYLEQTFTPMTAHRLKQELLKETEPCRKPPGAK